jgi:hypothetical protein
MILVNEIELSTIVEELKQLNKVRSGNFLEYKRGIREIFKISEPKPVTENSKLFLAGFIAGEGSVNVSAKKCSTGKFGLLIDPEFSITQHIDGFEYLYLPLSVFQTGRIRFKFGSCATFVYIINNRDFIESKVIPFLEDYVFPYECKMDRERVENFKQLLVLIRNKAHLDLSSFRNELLPVWDKLRKQKGQSNQTFKDLEEAQLYIENFFLEKNSELL